jgi:hypothetical protein
MEYGDGTGDDGELVMSCESVIVTLAGMCWRRKK